MDEVEKVLEAAYAGRDWMTRDELVRHAVAVAAPAEVVDGLETLPEGEYGYDEVGDALAQLRGSARAAGGIPGADLSDDDLFRELRQLHDTRHDTLRHGSAQALAHHDERLGELEAEYLRRFPGREVDPDRLRNG